MSIKPPGSFKLRDLSRSWPLMLGVTVVVLCAAAFWLLTAPRPAFDRDDAAALNLPGDAERGRIVFAAGDCGSCHASPGQADPLRLGGGLALASPFGTLHVPNISQDPLDGIGRWRTVDLANALLSGVSPSSHHSSSHHYYPVFPYSSFAHMRVADIVDLMAYLRTLPAVAGRAPPHELPFPFNVRRLIGVWKLLYLDRSPIAAEKSRPEGWNRGHYLVDAVGHCAECHSSRNLLGAIKEKTRFAGGRDPEGTGYVPNITPEGIGAWSQADLERLLENGSTPDLRTVGSSMAGVVENTRSLPAADRKAIAVYVKTIRARPTAEP